MSELDADVSAHGSTRRVSLREHLTEKRIDITGDIFYIDPPAPELYPDSRPCFYMLPGGAVFDSVELADPHCIYQWIEDTGPGSDKRMFITAGVVEGFYHPDDPAGWGR